MEAQIESAARLLSTGGGTIAEGSPLPSPFALFLVQVIVIIVLAKVIGRLIAPFKQPGVVAEMLAGIVLGPTLLGRVPGFTDALFPASSLTVLRTISSFGLCFFMFLVGLELETDKISSDFTIAVSVTAFDVIITTGASYALTPLFMNPVYSTASVGLLGLFLKCTIGMTALPVLARILSERRLLTTRVGSISMAIATIDDIIGYVLLAVCLALVRAPSQISILWIVLMMAFECVAMYYIIQPLLRVIIERGEAYSNLSANTFLLICIVLIGCCWFTEAIGLSSLIGAFQVGFFIPRNSALSHALTEKIEYFVVGILMPLYFTNSGLKTQFGLLNSWEGIGYALLVIVVATVSKATGTFFPCLYLGIPPRMAGVVSALMSCKGLVALIVVNYGIDYGIITDKFFAILILMVLVTTMQTVPLVDLIDPPSRAAESAAEAQAYALMVDRREEAAKVKVEAKAAAKAKAAVKLLKIASTAALETTSSSHGDPASSLNGVKSADHGGDTDAVASDDDDDAMPTPTGDMTPRALRDTLALKIEKERAKVFADRNILVDLFLPIPTMPTLDSFSLDAGAGEAGGGGNILFPPSQCWNAAG